MAVAVKARGRMLPGLLAGGLMAAGLGGCTSGIRQDPYLTANANRSTMIGDIAIYRDRPLAEGISETLVFADYQQLMQESRLYGTLRGRGPFTVLAVTNAGIESVPADALDRVRSVPYRSALRRYLGYTVIEGDWSRDRLFQEIRKHKGALVLRTFYRHDTITVRIDPVTNRLLFTDGAGLTQSPVIVSVPTSNGTLYGLDQPIRPVAG